MFTFENGSNLHNADRPKFAVDGGNATMSSRARSSSKFRVDCRDAYMPGCPLMMFIVRVAMERECGRGHRVQIIMNK